MTVSAKLHENRIMKACYSYQENGRSVCIMATYVDDLVWAVENEYAWIIDAIKQELTFGRMDAMKFRFCGREVEQSDNYGIKATC